MQEIDATKLLDQGREALSGGDWEAARAAFEALIAETPSAEAYEGLADAAWWQDDADVTISARERAYQYYRETNDNLGAARCAAWLGGDYLDFRGEAAVSSGWRQLAKRLLDEIPTAAEHGWFAAFEGDITLLLDEDTDTARRWAQEAIAIGRTLRISDIEVLGRTVEGLALVTEGDIAQGMKRLDEAAASALSGELKERFSVNLVLCHLIYACERAHDYSRAAQWCQRAREYADRMGFVWAQGTCRVHYAGVLLWRGKWSEAEQELEVASRYLLQSRPPYESEARVRLAELRRRQGRLEEAESLFRQADWHLLAAQGLAEMALESGRLVEAEEYVQRVLRNVPEKSVAQRAEALQLLVRIHAAAGRHEAARATYEEVQAISAVMATQPLLAASNSLSGVLAAAGGRHEQALGHFEDAAALFERCGAPFEAAKARLELAIVLQSLGRNERATHEASTALEALRTLGAQAEAARAEALVKSLNGSVAGASQQSLLTERQLEILRLVAQGLSDREIAAQLVMSEHTVHRHVANILLRLSLPSRAAAVAHASRLGVL